MADNDLRIIIQTTLDIQRSTVTLNQQLNQLSQKVNSIKLNVDTDKLKKSVMDYEDWWTKALNNVDKKREQSLQYEQNSRRKIEQEAIKDHEKSLKQLEQLDKAHYQALIEDQKKTMVQQQQLDKEYTASLKKQQELQRAAEGDSNSMGLGAKIKEMAVSVPLWFAGMTVFMTAIHAFTEGFSGMIEIEAKMAGYIQTNEKYFASFSDGSHEMVLDTQKVNAETEKFIQTSHALGSEIGNVLESARLWGRMYKDVGVVQELVRQSTQLSTVDLVSLNDATKMMEATLAQYGVQIHNVSDAQTEGNRILDSWSSVAHKTMAPAKDLGDAFERTGKIASETGVSFDFMNGLISAGVRNTALGGANLGNMWKTVLGTIRTDKAVNELERLGVKTKELVDGAEQWRKAEDILLDLSIAVTDKNYDLTKSYQDISRGVYQFAKLAASLNVGDILLGTSASINSTGTTLEYLKIQMDTIDRKAAQVKTSLLEVFNTAGDDGLRSSIKGILDVIDQLLMGLTKIPKGTFEAVATIVGLTAAYNLILVPIAAWKAGQVALNAAIVVHAAVNTAATESMVIFNAAAMATARSVALATAGITLLVGAVAIYVMGLGTEEKAERQLREEQEKAISIKEQTISQYQRQMEFLTTLSNAHDKLTEALKNQSLTEEQKTGITGQLDKVEQALAETVGAAGLSRIKAAGFTSESIQIEMNAMSDKRQQAISDTLKLINIDKIETQSKVTEAKKRIAILQEEMKAQKAKADSEPVVMTEKGLNFYESLPLVGGVIKALTPSTEKQKYAEMQSESIKQQKVLEDAQKRLDEISQKTNELVTDSVNDALAGASGKKTSQLGYDERKKMFDSKMKDFTHNVNMEAAGYEDAKGQLQKLKTIRDTFTDMDEDDLFSLDENIHRTEQGIANKAKGIPDGDQGAKSAANAAFANEKKAAEIENISNIKSQVKAIQEQHEATKLLNENLDKKASNLEKEHKYLEAVVATNEVIDGQTSRVQLLKKANEELHSTADKARENSKYGLNPELMNSWFDDNGEESSVHMKYKDKFADRANSINSSGQSEDSKRFALDRLKIEEDYTDKVYDNLSQVKKAYKDNANEIVKIEIDLASNKEKVKALDFTHSKEWIDNETSSMQLLGKSEVEVAQMSYDAWNRVLAKKGQYTEKDQKTIDENIIKANNERKKAEMSHSDLWIQEKIDQMTIAGKSEIEIAQEVSSARERMRNESWTKERGLIQLSASEQLKADKMAYDARIALQKLQQEKLKKQIEDEFSTIVSNATTAIDNTISKLKKSLDAKELFDMGELNNSIREITTALDILDGITSDSAKNVSNTDATKSKLATYKADILSTVALMNSMTTSTSTNASTLKSYIETQTAYAQSLKDKISDVNNLIKTTSDLYKREEESLSNQIKAQEKLNNAKVDGFKKSLDVAEAFNANNLTNSINTIVAALDVLDEKFASAVSKDSTNQARTDLASYRKEIDAVAKSLTDFQKSKVDDVTFKSGDAESSINAEIKYTTDLKTRIDNLNQSIATTTLRYQQEEDAIAQKIKVETDSADKQVTVLKDKLALLDQQVAAEDRLKKITDINSELDKAKNDKRFEYIDENGNKILTFNKTQVSELEKQRDELLLQYGRDDIKKALQDDIDRIEKNKTDTVKEFQEKLDKTKQINQQDLAAQKLYSSSLNELYGIILSNTNSKIEAFKALQDAGIVVMQTQLDKTKAIHQAELDALNLYQTQLSNVYGLIVQDTNNKIDALKAIYDKDLENMKSNFSKLVDAAMTGSISFNSILDVWKNSSISTLTDFGAQTATQVAKIKSEIDALNNLKINPISTPSKGGFVSIPTATGNNGGGSSVPSGGGGFAEPATASGTPATFYSGGGEGSPSYYNGGQPVYLHDGGTVGGKQLKPNEIPAILEIGEEVIKRFNMDKLKDIILKPMDFMNQITNQFRGLSFQTPDFSGLGNKGNNTTSQPIENHYHFNGDIRANNPMELFQGVNHLINSQKK